MKRRLCLILMAGLMLGTASSSFAEETEAEGKQDVAIPGNHEYDYGMDQFFKGKDY